VTRIVLVFASLLVALAVPSNAQEQTKAKAKTKVKTTAKGKKNATAKGKAKAKKDAKAKGKKNATAKAPTQAAQTSADMVLIVGAAGESKFGGLFRKWARRWESAAKKGKLQITIIGADKSPAKPSDREKLETRLATLKKDGKKPLWIVYVGHGTFDRKNARLNLVGRDVSASELGKLLDSFSRPVVFVHSGASSAPFINRLSKAGRVIVTATKSGYESNFAYFGEYVSAAIADPKADLDKDQQTSLLEAFLMASRQVAEFYKTNGRLSTEQALIDDNGDARGTPASFFRGIRVAQQASEGNQADGLRANQLHLVKSPTELALPPKLRGQRDKLEQQLADLRSRKAALPSDQYYDRLEKILVQIAKLYASTDK